ncbi:unnamed protein product [Gordionus sp. m RMFG-2023]
MSKFFAQVGPDSETESDESEIQQAPLQKSAVTKAFQLSDDEEDIKRLVRSAKDKREDEILGIAKQIKNHKKIKDMCKVLSDFEDLQKVYAKAKGVLDDKDGRPPTTFLKCLTELEDFINEIWEDKEYKKAMSKNNSRGLSSLRQKLKKYNKDYEPFLLSFREKIKETTTKRSVGATRDDSESGEDDGILYDQASGDDDKIGGPGKELKVKKVSKIPREDDEDSIDWGQSDSEDSYLSDEEKYAENPSARFLKKQPDDKEKDKKKERGVKSKPLPKKVGGIGDDNEDAGDEQDETDKGKWESVTAKGGVSRATFKDKVIQIFSPDEEITRSSILKKLNDIISTRGKRGADRSEPLLMLQELLNIALAHSMDTPIVVKIMFNLIASYFDYNQKISPCMKAASWKSCLANLKEIIKLLHDNPNIKIGMQVNEEIEDEELQPDNKGKVIIKICVLSQLEIADEEFTKILQNCDAHSTEYLDRLKDEKTLCSLFDQLQSYLEIHGTANEISRIYHRQVEHMYYKNDKKQSLFTGDNKEGEDDNLVFEKYCKHIYNDNSHRMRTRSILCHIYYCALHDDWFKARDLLLMSHLQDTVQHSDLPTQTLYNRTMVQMGLCAFRRGLLKEAHDALLDIQSSGRAKELLGQGLISANPMARNLDPLTPEQEKAERTRQVPFHMHINLDVVEFVYLFCAVCIETPYIAQGELERRRMASKNFYYQLKQSERQLLIGPPDNIRDHVVAAHKAMKVGDWKACKNFIVNDKTKTKVWDLFPDTNNICEMITQKIKVECLRVYLFSYGNFYDSIDLKIFSEMFDMDIPTITNIISKMIINEEIMASFDEPSQALIMHRVDLNRIQSLVLQLTEKVAQFSDLNDKLAELKWSNQETISLYPNNNYSMNYSSNMNYQQKNFSENYYSYSNYRK